ncbi:hypothetical protein CAEBREN_21744 [Caenorhabditis brenneri]|uniref:Uncharacterized protein n=1 Tax=Caenorhabditis brenneri TaxID=135651 RepID=G0NFZ7_CAEBE|nr:hypothetical protein CAEBREN_21744 [Caenorhabditis brenneri]
MSSSNSMVRSSSRIRSAPKRYADEFIPTPVKCRKAKEDSVSTPVQKPLFVEITPEEIEEGIVRHCTQLLKCDDKRHALHRLLGADGDYWAFEKCKTMDVMYEECYEYPELHKLMYRVQEKIAYLRRRDTSPYYK